MRKAIWTLGIGVFGTVLMLMAQISAQDAKSNIGSWLNLFGFNSEWIQSGNIDIIVTVLGVSILVVAIIILLPKVIQNRLSGNKLMYIPGIIFIVIGITWVTVVYLNSSPLSKDGIHIELAEHWLNMSSQSKMVETRGDTAIRSEPDWRITSLYFEAKNKRSTKIKEVKGYVESNDTGEKFDILIDSYKPEETHGIPASIDFKISVIFPRSTPDREGWTFEDFWSQFGAFSLHLDFDGIKMTKQFNQKEIQEYIDTYMDSLPKRKQGKLRVERKQNQEVRPSVNRKTEIIKQLNQFVRNGNSLILKIDKAHISQFPSYPPKKNQKAFPMEQEVVKWDLAVYNYLKDNVPARAEYYHSLSMHDVPLKDYNIMSPQQKSREVLIALMEGYTGRIIEIISYVDSSSSN